VEEFQVTTKKKTRRSQKAIDRMTESNFDAISAAFGASRPEPSKTEAVEQWTKDVTKVMDALKKFNRNFDPERFVTACGLTIEEKAA